MGGGGGINQTGFEVKKRACGIEHLDFRQPQGSWDLLLWAQLQGSTLTDCWQPGSRAERQQGSEHVRDGHSRLWIKALVATQLHGQIQCWGLGWGRVGLNGMPLHNCCSLPDLSPMDAVSACTQKDEMTLRIVVRMPPQHIIKGVRCSKSKSRAWSWGRGQPCGCCGGWAWGFPDHTHSLSFGFQDLKQQEFFLGCSKVSGKVDWKVLDEAVCQVFKVHRVICGTWVSCARGLCSPW